MQENLYSNDCGIRDDSLGIKYCVFAGAGVLGVSYAGVCKALMEYNLQNEIKYWVGSSAGSIAATFIACGIDCYKLEKMLRNTKLNKLLDIGGVSEQKNFLDKMLWGTSSVELITKYGLARGNSMVSWLEEMLTEFGLKKDLTFSELYNKTGNHLIITGSCVNTSKSIYFSRSSTPNLKIVEAIRVSISMPLI